MFSVAAYSSRQVEPSCTAEGSCVVFLLHPDSDYLIISYQFFWERVTIPPRARAHTALDHLTLVAMTAAVKAALRCQRVSLTSPAGTPTPRPTRVLRLCVCV